MTDLELSMTHVACLQAIIAQGPTFGRNVKESLKEQGYDVALGTVLPKLHTMADRGYITETHCEETGRTIYEITEAGQKAAVV